MSEMVATNRFTPCPSGLSFSDETCGDAHAVQGVEDLTEEQRTRLPELLDDYLVGLEDGERLDASRIKEATEPRFM